MKYSYLLLSLLSVSVMAQTGPYKLSQSKANIAQRIVHVLDNSTVGAAQTVLGAAHVLVYLVLNPLQKEKLPSYGLHVNKESEVEQIVIDAYPIGNAAAYSLGLFQVGAYAEDHEGGHSVASAALGPLYLPTVGLSYLFESHDGSFMESWADMEAEPSKYMNTAAGLVGLGSTTVEGVRHDVVVYQFNIEQRQTMGDESLSSDKIYQWINTKIIHPIVKDQSPDQMPTLIEFDLLKKTLNIVVDNTQFYLEGNQEIRTSIQTEQRYLHIESNPVLKKMHIKALDWSAQYGLEYNLNNKLKVSPRVGMGMSADAFSQGSKDYYDLQFKDKYIWTGSMSLMASLDVKVMDYFTIKGQYQREMYFNGDRKNSVEVKIGNEFRNPLKKSGAFQFIELSAGYKNSNWKTQGQTLNMSQWNATIGIRL